MAKHNKLGKEGALIAFMILQRDKFTILETNWRFEKTEIDIIAQKDNLLIFTQVKTTRSNKFKKLSDSIEKNKITLYKKAVKNYLEQYPSESEVRFDVVNIIIGKDETQIEHIPNAF